MRKIVSLFQPKSCNAKRCTLCSLYIRMGLFALALLWLWGNIALLSAWIQGTPLPSNAATQAAILGDIAMPLYFFRKIIKQKRNAT